MPIYIGGHKANQLWWNGQKIKEAWYNGAKIFTSGPPTWTTQTRYTEGEIVAVTINGQTEHFRCTRLHWSDSTNRPGTGAYASTYWQRVQNPTEPTPTPTPGGGTSPTPVNWQPGKTYRAGDQVIWSGAGMRKIYECTRTHYSSEDYEPYWGLRGSEVWKHIRDL